ELRERFACLLPRDRVLLELAFEKELSLRQIAALLNCPAGSVSRRLRRTTDRLKQPIVALLTARHCQLPPEYRLLGIEHFLQGLSIKQLADEHQMTRGEVRRILDHLRGWSRALAVIGNSACE